MQGGGNGYLDSPNVQDIGVSDGFSTFGAASASARSTVEYSEVEAEENRYVGIRGNETEVEQRDRRRRTTQGGSFGSSLRGGQEGSRSITPTPPGIERK